jgi:hypothetical protein
VRGRACLLKGCQKHFVPRPQDLLRGKYCAPACRRRAKGHRTWLWRKTPPGREARRRENRRYREKHPTYQAEYRRGHIERVREIERESKRRCRLRKRNGAFEGSSAQDRDVEGSVGPSAGYPVHKGGPDAPDVTEVGCRRPGCYETFHVLGSLKAAYRYCRNGCAAIMRRFRSLCAQLRYRRTLWGNYRRKLCRVQGVLQSAPAPP